MMAQAYRQRRHPGAWMAAQKPLYEDATDRRRTDSVCGLYGCKDSEDSHRVQQLSLFPVSAPATSTTSTEENPDSAEMARFLDTIRPQVAHLNASDRLSIINAVYWTKAGEDKETIIPLLRKPLRAVFEGIIETMKY